MGERVPYGVVEGGARSKGIKGGGGVSVVLPYLKKPPLSENSLLEARACEAIGGAEQKSRPLG